MIWLRGADISRHQGPIDFLRFAPFVDELHMRATMGEIGVDDRFAEYWRESLWASIARRGFYHLPIAELGWRGQRENILRTTRGDFGNAKALFDVERRAYDRERMKAGWRFPREHFTDNLFELILRLISDGLPGARIYTNESEWIAMTTQPMEARAFGLHIAGYPSIATRTHADLERWLRTYRIRIPYPWNTLPADQQWEAWQGASTGRLPGAAGSVDLSLVRNLFAQIPGEVEIADILFHLDKIEMELNAIN